MIKAIISDFSNVLLFPKDKEFVGDLDVLHKGLSQQTHYKAFDNFLLNTKLLDFYQSLNETVDIYIFTDEALQDAAEFKPYLQQIFKKTFFTKTMGVLKKQTDAYTMICNELKTLPSDVIYIDDSEENIKIAKLAGVHARLFTDNETIIKEIKKLIV
ncbi:hypothetical protein GW793_03710 [bacterium]|uniref:Haloacid dehalogenase n=2 Tax=Katanobacteria TaxID=422282 RepID=A0A2M7X129_UNCKA|nr:hypothetical protein [bacterium]PIP56423.1 MAG: hypothetical protein COX05_03115 [candidate division WWE3 bacterium CG22_combo_CG10-13_8_21_14_all_39_12]PJA39886.1 MAG: hypothetical protein CO179_04085 [candidate division WWE3 bacterium CG_4_9_14_3_um_filter_39_7]